jgi:hypothetical protein
LENVLQRRLAHVRCVGEQLTQLLDLLFSVRRLYDPWGAVLSDGAGIVVSFLVDL